MTTWSLRARLALLTAALLLAASRLLAVIGHGYARSAADRSFDQLLTASASSIAEALTLDRGRIDLDLPYAALDMLSAASDDRVFYGVSDPAGRIVSGYGDLPAVPAHAVDRQQPLLFDSVYRGVPTRFVVLLRQIAPGGEERPVTVVVGQTRTARDRLTRELEVRLLLPIVAVTALALAAIWFGVGRALKPLDAIGRELAERSPTSLGPVAAPVPREVAPLVLALDGFMQRLEANIATLRGFLAEAAHQMRTPLAGMLAQAQASPGSDVAGYARSMASIERNATKLTRLVNQMLADAIVTHRTDVQPRQPLDLLAVIDQAVREAVPVSAGASVQVESALADAPYRGDPLMLGEAIGNLIDNAVRYAVPHDPRIVVALAQDAEGYVLAVRDYGPSIPAAQREAVFARFVRGDTQLPGAGLGLAIVQTVAACEGGGITLHDAPGGGLEARLRLPRRP